MNHTIIRTYKDTSSVAIQQSETITADTERNFDGALPIAANHEIVMAFTHANLKTFCITSDQAITVFTNNPSGSTPQDTIPVVAGQALLWTLATDGIGKCPFSDNVTALYVTNASSAVANVKIRSLQVQF